MMAWWQHLPEYIDPIAFQVGFFSIRWYALCWLAGFISALWYTLFFQGSNHLMERSEIVDIYLILFFGALFGGHVGFLLLYQPLLSSEQLVLFFSPLDASGNWVGVSGMSFHGGLIGALAALGYFSWSRRANFLVLADSIALAAPLALFFGRIGNFLNGELPGRITTLPWGMYFPFDVILRHPSTLYEALLEGMVLFCLLFLAKKRLKNGQLSALFLVLYGVLRCLVEFFREPDPGIALLFSLFTRGQVLSLLMVFSGGLLFLWLRKKNHDKLER